MAGKRSGRWAQLSRFLLQPHERGKGSAMNMWKIAPVIFIVLGILDIIYGLLMNDRISLLMGPILIVIAVYIAARNRRQAAHRQ
jgi:hypothetical protein